MQAAEWSKFRHNDNNDNDFDLSESKFPLIHFKSLSLSLSVIQTYTAIYYVIADLMMLAMYLYYKIRNKMVESKYAFFFLTSVVNVFLFLSSLSKSPTIESDYIVVLLEEMSWVCSLGL